MEVFFIHHWSGFGILETALFLNVLDEIIALFVEGCLYRQHISYPVLLSQLSLTCSLLQVVLLNITYIFL